MPPTIHLGDSQHDLITFLANRRGKLDRKMCDWVVLGRHRFRAISVVLNELANNQLRNFWPTNTKTFNC
jgi:hypothetical protein